MGLYFKKEFLGQWMKSRGITSYAMKEILGLKSVNHIEVWAGIKPPPPANKPKEDQGWLPLIHILKIINRFPDDVKLSDFIGNAEDITPTRSRQVKADIAKMQRQQEELSALREQLLKSRLDHLEEIRAIETKYREREDRIREQYDTTIQRLLSRVADIENPRPADRTRVNDPLEKPSVQL